MAPLFLRTAGKLNCCRSPDCISDVTAEVLAVLVDEPDERVFIFFWRQRSVSLGIGSLALENDLVLYHPPPVAGVAWRQRDRADTRLCSVIG